MRQTADLQAPGVSLDKLNSNTPLPMFDLFLQLCRKAAVAYGWPPIHPSGGRRCSSWRTARSGFCGRCAFWCLFSCTRYVTGAHLPLALCLSKQQPRPRCSHQNLSQQGWGMRQAGSSIAGSGKSGRLGA